MKRFVDECRREWKRLRVADPVADEMAADLVADLEEAEAEGVTPEEVLGSGASDPRSFAASWATERGVIPRRLTAGLQRRSLMLAALAALTITAALGAALVIFASPDASVPTAAVRLSPPYPINVSFDRDGLAQAEVSALREAEFAHTRAVLVTQVPGAALVQPSGGIVLTLPQAHDAGVEIHTIGSILLIVGIVGSIVSMLLLFWSSSSRRSTCRDRRPCLDRMHFSATGY